MRPFELFGAFFLSALAVVLVQLRFGAFDAALCSDAALHFMTATMFRDYLEGGLPGSPLTYLLDYFGHYQMLGLGHWPPVFHGLLATWMLIVGVGKPEALLFTAVLAGSLAALAFWIVRPRFGLVVAFLAALLVVTNPLIQSESVQIMVDIASGLFSLLAVLCFASFVRTSSWRDSALFGVVSALALLTKGNAALLVIVPPLVLLLTRRWNLVLEPSLWIAPVVVIGLAGPFYWVTRGWSAQGFLFEAGWDYTTLAIEHNARSMWQAFGPVTLTLAAVGALNRAVRLGGSEDPALPSLFALALATFIFQAVTPVAIQARYLVPLVVPIVVLAIAGIDDVLRTVTRSTKIRVVCSVVALSVLAFATLPSNRLSEREQCRDMQSVALAALQKLTPTNPVVLVAAHSTGEQAFATEIAIRDAHRPSFVVAFGSRLFGRGGFMNNQYAERYDSDADIETVIERLAIPYVVIDLSKQSLAWGHNQRLLRLAESRGWMLQSRFTTADGAEVRLYRLEANAYRPMARSALAEALAPRRKVPGT